MSEDQHCCKERHRHRQGGGQALYGLGVLGAAVYFVQAATGFWSGVLGLLKAFFWPALVVHKAFQLWGL
jgi:hypothetical protein